MPEIHKEKEKRTKGSTKKASRTKAEGSSVQRSESGQRLLQTPKRVWRKPLTWRNHPPVPVYRPLPKAHKLFWSVMKQLWTNRKSFLGIVVIYAVLNIFLVRGLSGSADLTNLKSTLDSSVSGAGGKLAGSLLAFNYLLSSTGSGNTAQSGIYQSILLVVCSLAFIWAHRQVLAGRAVQMRESFYQGMYPLVPFLIVFLLMGVQLLPLVIGGSLYKTVISGGIAIYLWEKAIWLLLFVGLALWSLRMITASVFALYIATLPDMTPLRAYRSARQLVYGRRLLIWRKFLFLPAALLVLAAVIEVPFILFITPLAVWTFFIVGVVALPVVHGYLYSLYREML